MKTQIPIYRAKKIDSDEDIEGYLTYTEKAIAGSIMSGNASYTTGYFIYNPTENSNYHIDPSTLAIHFPDMIDSDGTKIFASLSEDGRGGSILKDYSDYWEGETIVAKYKNGELVVDDGNDKKSGMYIENCTSLEDWEVTGIQE